MGWKGDKNIVDKRGKMKIMRKKSTSNNKNGWKRRVKSGLGIRSFAHGSFAHSLRSLKTN